MRRGSGTGPFGLNPTQEARVGLTIAAVAIGGMFAAATIAVEAEHRRINAHSVVLTGTITDTFEPADSTDRTYTVAYEYAGRTWEDDGVDGPTDDLVAGDSICVEIDATAPTHARGCGERPDTVLHLLVGAVFCALLLYAVYRRGFEVR